MSQAANGIPATSLRVATWKKSRHSNPHGDCVELGELARGQIAVRNSRHPDGPALIFPRAAIIALIRDAAEDKFKTL